MKANEAPEKIYVHVRANKELGTTWHGKKITNGDIEYTSTDAFIDKACEWLKDNARNYYSAYATEDRLIEDFKKAMKGGEE